MARLISRKSLWWWLLIIGVGLVALALLTPQAKAEVEKPQALHINMGDMWRAKGISMQPVIMDGDYVLVRPSNAKPRIGKVVLFYEPLDATYFTHRVIEVGEDSFGWWARTKGDNLRDPDLFYLRVSNMIGVGLWRITIW